MSKLFDSLTDKDVQVIERLAGALNDSAFDFLELRLGDTQLSLGKGMAPGASAAVVSAPTAAPAPVAVAETAEENTATPIHTQAAAPDQGSTVPEIEPGFIAIKAPTIGRFYARPEPTAKPYVTVGTKVEVGDTVGLVEVMKLFNSVDSEASGTVSQIFVEDGALVEYGQVLMTIKPAEAN